MFNNFFFKIKYGTAGQTTDDNGFGCWIIKVTDILRICDTYCISA